MVDFKEDTKRASRGLYRGDIRESFRESKVVISVSVQLSNTTIQKVTTQKSLQVI